MSMHWTVWISSIVEDKVTSCNWV